MKKGENIFKRKDGRWEARYIKGYELSGKIKYGFCYGKTYKEAKRKSDKVQSGTYQRKAVTVRKFPTPLCFYCDEWLRLRKKQNTESTYIQV